MPDDETMIDELCSEIVTAEFAPGAQKHWEIIQCFHRIGEILIKQDRRLRNLERVIGRYEELQ